MSNNIPTGTIIFDVVSKRYRLGTLGTLRSTVESLLQKRQHNDDKRDFWALKDVSFRVEPGDSLALIGPNGAGKTTVLKLLSNITQPTTGRIAVSGRISSLIELGAGFHPELTGRENIFLNGAILGLSRREIQRKLDEIIAFAELERFIDTPVKRYSSGMYVRLGFAVAAHVEPDVLLIDEVLAVGDAGFRQRCTQHMKTLMQKGTSMIFVSHNMHLVRNMCDSALLLMNGQIQAQGKSSEVIVAYENMPKTFGNTKSDSRQPGTLDEYSSLQLPDIDILPLHTTGDDKLFGHHPAIVRIRYQAAFPQPFGQITVFIARQHDQSPCSQVSLYNDPDSSVVPHELSESGLLEVTYNPLQLTSGTYYVVAKITDISDSKVIAETPRKTFHVHSTGVSSSWGVYEPNVRWTHHGPREQLSDEGEG